MEFLNLGLIVVLFFLVHDLQVRVKNLKNGSNSQQPQSSPVPIASVELPATVNIQPIQSAVHPMTPQPAEVNGVTFDVVAWMKQDWLLKLGGLFLLTACGWFVSYAFMEGWVGPLGRIMFGLLFGAVILCFGWFRIQTYRDQGAIFLVLGSTIVLLTTYAARSIYDFFTPTSALALMFLVSAFVAYVSALYRHRNLGVAGVLLAGCAPLLTNSPSVDQFGLFAYLLAVVAGSLIVVLHTGYRELTLASFLVVAFYSVPQFLPGVVTGDDRILIFGFIFATIFFIANIIGMVRRGSISIPHDTLLAVGNAFLLVLCINNFIPSEWKSLVTVAWALVFTAGSFMALRLTRSREPFFIYAAISIGYLATATAFQLSGPALTIAYSIEAALVTILTLKLFNNRAFGERASMLLLVSVGLSLPSLISSSWVGGIFHNDMLVLVTVGLTLAIVGLVLQGQKDTELSSPEEYTSWQLILGSLYGYALIWLILHATLSVNVATMFSLIMYIVCGLTAYFYGSFRQSKTIRAYGVVVLLVTTARLLLIDVWLLDLPGRIITFFSIGVLLLSTAFIRKRTAVQDTSIHTL